MTLKSLRISVGRTWRFDSSGSVCVDDDLTAYRRRIDQLKGGGAESEFGLPWPPYRSRFWYYMLSPSYQDTRSRVQVATLLPFRWSTSSRVVPWARGRIRAEIEALRHPFAITTLVHLDLAPMGTWPEATEASQMLREVLRGTLTASNRVEDGVPLAVLPSIPKVEFEGRPMGFVDAGRYVLVSALHTEEDGLIPASSLALRFDDTPKPDKATSVRSDGGAVCLSGETVGLALPAMLPRSNERLRCLHHNYALLLAYVQNLAAVASSSPTQSGRWYRDRAAIVLNHLYRRAPLPETNSIYKSRLPDLWMTQRGLVPTVNALTPGLPPLPG